MRNWLLAASLLALTGAPAAGQQLSELVPPTISPADPALAGIILDTVVPLAPAGGLGTLRPVPPALLSGLQPARPTFGFVAPASGIGFDARTGSVYRWSQLASGRVEVRGTNMQTGSMWYGTIRPSGMMSGFDGDLNFWRYDLKSGLYTNTTTGEICVGQGPTGRC